MTISIHVTCRGPQHQILVCGSAKFLTFPVHLTTASSLLTLPRRDTREMLCGRLCLLRRWVPPHVLCLIVSYDSMCRSPCQCASLAGLVDVSVADSPKNPRFRAMRTPSVPLRWDINKASAIGEASCTRTSPVIGSDHSKGMQEIGI